MNYDYKDRLWNSLEKDVLPFVSKPGRYVGNEFNAIVKDIDAKLKVVLAFPDIYEVGSSYLGMQILYHMINRRHDCLAERVFQVWPDMEDRLRLTGIPLFSLETSTPLKNFDVIGFSVTYEMHAAGILNILDLAQIPLLASDRDESYPLIIAGGPAIINPEPLAEFFDAFFLGDVEDSLDELLDTLIASKGKSRRETLKSLATIQGVYIPSFYEILADGDSLPRRKFDFAPEKINVQLCKVLRTENYPDKPLVPFLEITHDRPAVEIMRGCVRGCRFCQAGYQYRPRRNRPLEQIVDQVNGIIKNTGYDEITLLSLSSTDYPELELLMHRLWAQAIDKNYSISLPSLRPGSLNSRLLEILKSQRKSGLTFAPEAGTQRLRNILGKDITEDEILGGIRLAFAEDWQLIKLYFMIGLPGETEDDIAGIAELLKKASTIARQGGRNKKINVTISPFCPKPGTPWQWEKQRSAEEIEQIYRQLRRLIKMSNVTLKLRNPHLAILEGIIGRGDRRLAKVIMSAFNNGSRLDGWSEHFRFEFWRKAFLDNQIDYSSYLEAKNPKEKLPWDHIDKGIPKRYLILEKEKAQRELPVSRPKVSKGTVLAYGNRQYGRPVIAKKDDSSSTVSLSVRFKFGRDESLRFYSHLDIMRALQRAIRRAQLPVTYSAGFNQHMKMTFGHPLPLGYTSKAEYFDLQLEKPIDDLAVSNFVRSLPQGFTLFSAKAIRGESLSLVRTINLISYRVYFANEVSISQEMINRLRDSKELIITRKKPDSIKQISARELLISIALNDNAIDMELLTTQEKNLRPTEVLIYGLGLAEDEARRLLIERTGQYHLLGIHKIDPMQSV